VDAPSLQAFKARLDVALGSLVCWLATLHIAGGWNWMRHCGPFQPRPFYDCRVGGARKSRAGTFSTQKESSIFKIHAVD